MLKKLLGFDPQTMALRTEIIAGITTFLTMSYILAVNPSILATTGMDQRRCFYCNRFGFGPRYLAAGFYGKVAFCPGSQYGTERLFRFYVGAGHGLFLADRYDSDVCEGVIFILITFLNVPGGDLE